MADPVTMLQIGATVATAVGGFVTADAQAEAASKKAAVDAQWAERRALEERATAQKVAGEENRKAAFAQSRLGAVAGASGSGASDPGVMNLFEQIQGEGDLNAATAMATGNQRAQAIEYQSALDRWTADSNAKINRFGATTTLIGGLMGGAGKGMESHYRMASRYGGGKSYYAGTGYGR